ncbi:MAG: 4-hydroxy-tetrahydrodipicolinate synthase [Lentimicrobiaceae bacterium]|jgi:4-hydroxy-tetrahydrodipicolinate synthase|nr:4-hydroxy-tetrahydrodipicolinate synthase [Lentimicrobiaceae bacterium]
MLKKFTGTGVALVTPFHKHGTVDFSSLEKLVEHLISNGINYLVVLGTTGETATLSSDEKNAVIDFVTDIVGKRVPVVVGMGGYNTQEIINRMHDFNFENVDAILSVTPYYNKPQTRGLYLHYKTIADSCPVPVILYNVPGRTCVNLTAETVLTLANEHSNIIGIKEASGNLSQIMYLIRNKPKNFLVISGDDNLTLPILAMGGDGVISVVANAFPAEFSEMVNWGLKSNIIKAREIHYKLQPFMEAIFADGNPAGIKAALELLGICQNTLRLPLVKVNKQVHNTIDSILNDLLK